MECQDARELLDLFLAEELLVETNQELLRHLSGCLECKADLDVRAMLRTRLKQAFDRRVDFQMRPEFADGLATRLRASALTGRRSWRAGWLTVAAAASVLLGVAASVYFLRQPAPDMAVLAAGDHQNCAVKFALTERPISLDEAAARYDPAYARLRTAPPDEVTTGAGTLHAAERHSCVFRNRRFGHVVFRLDQHVVSVLMTSDSSGAGSEPGMQQLSWLPSSDGLSMASYRTPGHIVYIVSDLQEPAFRQVAESLTASRLAALRHIVIPVMPVEEGR